MSKAEQNVPFPDEAYLSIREKVAEHIKPDRVDEVMHRPLPLFENMTLSEAVTENPHLAQEMVEAMFNWQDAQGV